MPSKKSTPRGRERPVDKARSKGHVIALSGPGSSPFLPPRLTLRSSHFRGGITSLPIFKIFRRLDGRTVDREERQGMDFLLSLNYYAK